MLQYISVLLITYRFLFQSVFSCDTFENISVRLKDVNNVSYNETVNGCIDEKTFQGIEVRELCIRQQVIPVLGENTVTNLTFLNTVSFWGNKMQLMQPNGFKNLPILKNVQISYGNLKEIPRGAFNNLPSIVLLRIHDNEIDIIEDQAFANLISLKRIDGSNNRMEYWNREWFTNTTQIEIMDFQNNYIRTIPRRAFANLIHLKQIFFDSNEISAIHADAFKGITKLDYLGLRYNRIKEIKSNIFPNDLNIRSFLLDANYLNFLPNEILEKLSVKDITLDNNPWKCPCLDRIKFWLYQTNGTMRIGGSCTGPNIPVCAYASSFSQSCLEIVDEEVTKKFIAALKVVRPPLRSHCAKLD